MDRAEVVIVGAGPAGLVAAIALVRRGIDTLLVERRHDRSGLPRATVVSTRSMELFRSWGIESQVTAGGNEVDWQLWESPTLAEADRGTAVLVGLPTRREATLVSPTAPACAPQDHLEAVLLDHLRAIGGRVRLGVEVTGAEHGPDGVRLRVRCDGADRRLEARYAIGADGSRSSVRSALGVAMRGPERLGESVSILFRAPLWPVVGVHRYGIYSTVAPGAEGIFLPAGRGDRWVYAIERPAGVATAQFSPAAMTARIRAAAGVDALPVDIERIGTFSFAAQIADRFRERDVFLIGDAAHRVTPRGGTGMNAAIADGFDLGWRLGWVLRGWASERLLDGYERERRPVVEHNLARSIDPAGSRRPVLDELLNDLGGRIPHAWTQPGTADRSTLDLLTDGLTIFVDAADVAWRSAARALGGETPPIAVGALDPPVARAMGIVGGGALLVRPDGVPVARWSSPIAARAALRVAAAGLTGIPQELSVDPAA